MASHTQPRKRLRPRPKHILFGRLISLTMAFICAAVGLIAIFSGFEYLPAAVAAFPMAIAMLISASHTIKDGWRIFDFQCPKAWEKDGVITIDYAGWKILTPLLLFLIGGYTAVAIEALNPNKSSPFGDFGTPTVLGWVFLVGGTVAIFYSFTQAPTYRYEVSPNWFSFTVTHRGQSMRLQTDNPVYIPDYQSGTSRLYGFEIDGLKLVSGEPVPFPSVYENPDSTYKMVWEPETSTGVRRSEVIAHVFG